MFSPLKCILGYVFGGAAEGGLMSSKDSLSLEKQQSNNRPAVQYNIMILLQMELKIFIQNHILTLFNHSLV